MIKLYQMYASYCAVFNKAISDNKLKWLNMSHIALFKY